MNSSSALNLEESTSPLSSAVFDRLLTTEEGASMTNEVCLATPQVFDVFAHLARHAPSFPVDSKNIYIIGSPTEYYESIKAGILGARKRIVLSALYLGIEKLERELIDVLRVALEADEARRLADSTLSPLTIDIVIDCLRGTRGKVNSQTIIQPLVDDFPQQCRLFLYHSHQLSGWRRRLLPSRYNESVGVHHMKVLLFDNDVIITGANLSDTYFTNRQDRYILFRQEKYIANYFVDLFEVIASISFQVAAKDKSTLHIYRREEAEEDDVAVDMHQQHIPPFPHPFRQSKYFRENAREKLLIFLARQHAIADGLKEDPLFPFNSLHHDTFAIPMIQIGTLDIRQEQHGTEYIISNGGIYSESQIFLTSGYFNMTPQLEKLLIASESKCTVVAASPTANSWYKAAGLACYVTDAYTHLEKIFIDNVKKENREKSVQLLEYTRPGWTYHAKGLWYTFPKEQTPCLTVIGSTNFGHRSMERDSEVQICLVTSNVELRRKLKGEIDDIMGQHYDIANDELFQRPDRHVTWWLKWLLKTPMRTML